MPISVYWLIYKDTDCQKLAPSNKSKVKTYSTEKIQIVGSSDLFVLHPETKCLQEVTFQVTSHEGSVIVSCATSLELGLIQPHRNLDVVPDSGNVIYSKADALMKQKYKMAPVYKLSNIMYSSEMQSSLVSRVQVTKLSSVWTKTFKQKASNSSVKLQFLQCFMTEIVKKQKMLTYGQSSQSWTQFICGQIEQQWRYSTRCQRSK